MRLRSVVLLIPLALAIAGSPALGDDPPGAPEEAVEKAPANREMDLEALEAKQGVGHQATPSTAVTVVSAGRTGPLPTMRIATESAWKRPAASFTAGCRRSTSSISRAEIL